MKELVAARVRITDALWGPRLETNATAALSHQWGQLEKTGCIENFRLLAEGKPGFREGWFFADSDAYKWLDAAARVYAGHPSEELGQRMEDFISLIARAQAEDGYLYTYNQLHFPEVRWTNLQIEHELYCHGHLIEAAVAHYHATGQAHLLALAQKAADLLVREFLGAGPECTPGHQEIEIALIRLYRATGVEQYLALAEQFLEQRGRVWPFAPLIYRQKANVDRRSALVEEKRARYLAEHPEHAAFQPGAKNPFIAPPGTPLRFTLSALSGKYLQQHRPVRRQTVPVGHAVRFAYLETALAMLYRERGDGSLLPALERAWEHMVNRRMYVTGGIGSLPGLEGFGRDYELDPEVAYAETCAALGCLLWNWEMALISGQAKYADLFEWQLYNAASVGMGLDGRSYLYNNPLASRGEVTRQAWYHVPCCPSNLSRTWASLGRSLYSHEGDSLWVHQYIGSEAEVDLSVPVCVEMESELPWQGRVRLAVSLRSPAPFTLHLRIPSWAGDCRLAINGQVHEPAPLPAAAVPAEQPASGYAPQRASYLPVSRTWAPGDVLEIEFPMAITVRQAHPRVKSVRGRVALTRGPLVYCLESVDNPGLDPLAARLDLSTVRGEWNQDLFEGIWVLLGETVEGKAVTAIPYAYWANRGLSQMAVWLTG
jgi:DUF1680 family protein